MLNGPCFKCTKRRMNCHSECEDYISFKKELDAHNEMIRKKKMADQPNRRFYAVRNSKGETQWLKKRTSD